MQPYAGLKIDKIAGIEARGFILGGAMAHQLSAGFVPIRKKGKLPHETVRVAYSLEYGLDEMEMHKDASRAGEKVILVDDLIATRNGGGGQAAAPDGRGHSRRLLRHRPAGSRRAPKTRRDGAHADLLLRPATAAAVCGVDTGRIPDLGQETDWSGVPRRSARPAHGHIKNRNRRPMAAPCRGWS